MRNGPQGGSPSSVGGLADPSAEAAPADQLGNPGWEAGYKRRARWTWPVRRVRGAGSGRWALRTWPATVQAVVISDQGRMAARSADAAGPRAEVRALRRRGGLPSPQVRKASHVIA